MATQQGKTPSAAPWILGILMIMGAGIGWMMANEPEKAPNPDVQKASPRLYSDHLFKPESLVISSDTTFACNSKESLAQLVEHMTKGEDTKAKGLFLRGECATIEPKTVVKVLVHTGTAMEIVPADSAETNGSWADPRLFAPLGKKK
jgi:hypothetical protein